MRNPEWGMERSMACRCAAGAFAFVVALGGHGFAAEEPQSTKRAKPPVWSQDVLDEFLPDARAALVGDRPAKSTPTVAADSAEGRGTGASPHSNEGPAAWSQLIDSETLASEVKRLAAGLREPLANPGKFKAGGFKSCRSDFNELAILFAVIAEFDGDVRWKEEAPSLRGRFAAAAKSCTSGTDQSFAEAVELKTLLEDLVRGERLGSAPAPVPSRWSDVADRPLLMKRMERALQEQISPALANSKEFTKRAAVLGQEAEVLGMLAAVIDREEFEYWDDESFQEQSDALRDATRELRRAAVEGNYDAARAAAGRAGQSCSACHEGYRG